MSFVVSGQTTLSQDFFDEKCVVTEGNIMPGELHKMVGKGLLPGTQGVNSKRNHELLFGVE
jgi:hypothetical protein